MFQYGVKITQFLSSRVGCCFFPRSLFGEGNATFAITELQVCLEAVVCNKVRRSFEHDECSLIGAHKCLHMVGSPGGGYSICKQLITQDWPSSVESVDQQWLLGSFSMQEPRSTCEPLINITSAVLNPGYAEKGFGVSQITCITYNQP